MATLTPLAFSSASASTSPACSAASRPETTETLTGRSRTFASSLVAVSAGGGTAGVFASTLAASS